MHDSHPSDKQSGEPFAKPSFADRPASAGFSRRDFLTRALVTGGALSAGLAAGVPSALAKPDRITKIRKSQPSRIILKFSMSGKADSGEGVASVYVAKRLSHLTHGEMGMLVYPNHTLSPSDEAEVQQMVVGALDLAAISSWTNVLTDGVAFDLPYAFATLKQLRKAFAGPPGQAVKASAQGLGFKVFDWWALTWRNLYGDKPIYTPDDLKGVKVRTQGTKPVNAYYAAAGAYPQTITSQEVYLALQTKQVDLVESSFQFCWQQKHYEVAKYGTADHHGISTWALCVSDKTWNKLNTDQQNALQQAWEDSVPVHDKATVKYVQSLIPELRQQGGMTINVPNLKPFAQIGYTVYDQVVTSKSQQNVLSEIQKMGFAKA